MIRAPFARERQQVLEEGPCVQGPEFDQNLTEEVVRGAFGLHAEGLIKGSGGDGTFLDQKFAEFHGKAARPRGGPINLRSFLFYDINKARINCQTGRD